MLSAFILSKNNFGFKYVIKNFTLKRIRVNNVITVIPNRYISSESVKNQINEISNNLSDIQVNNIIIDPSFESVNLNNLTPAGLIQWLLENIHINLDLPWWGCIASIAVLFKLVDLPRIYTMNRSIGKDQINSESDNAPVKLSRVAQLTNNKISDIKPKSELSFDQIYQVFNFGYQGFIFLSLYSAIEGIIVADIPSFTNGGLLWFPNLSISDPYFLLPIISSATFVAFIESNRSYTNVRTSKLANILFGFCACGVLTQLPSSFALYWTCSNIITYSFASILKINLIRRMLKFPVLAKKSNFQFLDRMQDKETEILEMMSKSFDKSLIGKLKNKMKKS